MPRVGFWKGVEQEYMGLSSLNQIKSNTLYFIEDKSRIYLGSKLIADFTDLSVLDDYYTKAESDSSFNATNSAVDNLNDRVDTLEGTGEGSVEYIAAQKIAEWVADAPADFDTLKEVADWIATDTQGSAAMQTAIAALKAEIGGTQNSASGFTNSRIDTLESDIDSANSRIDTLENDINSTNNKVNTLENNINSANNKINTLEEKVDVDKVSTAISTALENKIQYGTEDMVEGDSLATGVLYFVYE